MITAAKQPAPFAIPDRKGKITDKFFSAPFLPLLICGQNDNTVGNRPGLLFRDADTIDQLFPVVYAAVNNEGKFTRRVMQRQMFMQGFRGGVQNAVAETDLLRRPKDKFSASLFYPFLSGVAIQASLWFLQ